MTCGVPQGSILGPLLFIIYVNDICNVSDLLFKLLYADDTCVVAQGHNLEDLIDTLNTELSSLNEWLLCNKLTLNTNKTYYMVFHRARIKLTNIDIGINGSKLQRVKCVKYLGLMVDQKLKWIDHIAHVKHKVAHGLGIINKAKPFLIKKASGTCTIRLYTHISLIVWKFGVMQQLLICYLCVFFKIKWLG